MLKWLDLDWIKRHSRIVGNAENDYLEELGEGAEDQVLNIINRSYTEVIEVYGKVPIGLTRAALMLIEADYVNRSTELTNQQYENPSISRHLNPYVKLASTNESNNNQYGKRCNL